MITLNDNNKIPTVLFGTFLISKEETIEKSIDIALSAGYRGFDTATVYKNENYIGNAIKKLLPKYNLTRADIFITSKLSPKDQGYENAKAAIQKSVSSVGLDYLDLYLIHWPGTAKLAKESPHQLKNRRGTWLAFEEAKKNGLLRSIGVSNYTVNHLKQMKDYSSVMPAVNQVECHPYLVQHDLYQYCKENGVHFQAYSSLGTTEDHKKLMENPTIQKISQEVGKSVAQVLLKWSVQRGVSVLPKSTNPEHIRSNIDLFSWKLSDFQLDQLSGLNDDKHFCWDPNTVA